MTTAHEKWPSILTSALIVAVVVLFSDGTAAQEVPPNDDAAATETIDAAPAQLSPDPEEPEEEDDDDDEWAGPADLDIDSVALRPEPDLARGAELYRVSCAVCHGRDGQGDGPGGRFMRPKPRDLTRGVYMLRSTGSGELPTDDDLFRVISRGMRGTGMPPWAGLSIDDRWHLVEYTKSFSSRFTDESPGDVIAIPSPAPRATPELVARGAAIYVVMKCGECHGSGGRGDGPAAETLKDDLGEQVYAFDMTRGWKLKGGTDPRDVFRTFHTGLDGTPMPSYDGILSDRDSWALVHYIRSLFQDTRGH